MNPLSLYTALAETRSPEDVYLFESLDGPARDRQAATVGWGRLAELRFIADRCELTAAGPLGDALRAVVTGILGAPARREGPTDAWAVPGPARLWAVVRAVQGAFTVDTTAPADSFTFGFLTTLAYEAARDMDEVAVERAADDLPRCTLTLYRHTVWWDLRAGTVHQLCSSGPHLPPDPTPPATELLAGHADDPAEVPAAPPPALVRDNLDEATFAGRVRRCLRHIEVGDSYQIQIGHRIEVETDLTPLQVYRRLRHRNPSPYMYLAPWAGRTVIGASPELFLRIDAGRLSMRPIAGTAARAADPELDRERVAELLASEKERAEHVMLVDLCRNDIGRVCEPGTLSVDAMLDVEPFAYVHHLVSTVSGRLADDADVWAAICASFPAGTMTGAPKLRAMEIIDGLEEEPRGIYAGAIGLVDVRGFAVLALCIRTAVHDGHRYRTQASAGVVADSTPAAEWRETLAKMSATYWALTGEELLP
ncbi:anthranilate synthase component I family protein [Micromonospora auratinigra]|uniref:Anthranilate synthase component 1 n=1 Tax=Micromonospora auratinigra TaxID=261654 RepID=A0A1A8ZHL6_9ACTN|nr:anthranilate synthase component I family protein [Micromonospora auratinigra]SBT43323.1 anthranilate synthase component 1 [Micromonospora auratinigra]